MSKRPKFDGHEFIAIIMAVYEHGFSKEFSKKLFEKVARNTNLRSPGRPKKKLRYSLDVQRAVVIEHLREEWPDDNDQELIELAQALGHFGKMLEEKKIPDEWMKLVPDELESHYGQPSKLSRLFPFSSDLASSVSRGKKKLRGEN